MMLFETHLHAGWDTNANPPMGTVDPDSNALRVAGFRVDTAAEVIDWTFSCLRSDGRPLPATAEVFVNWEAAGLELARKVYYSSSPHKGDIPMAHIYTLTANTWTRISRLFSKASEGIVRQSWLEIPARCRAEAYGGNFDEPPDERKKLYRHLLSRFWRGCSGRRCFSTGNGRVGLGPPAMKAGDKVCVFYNCGPVFMLRSLKTAEGDGWEIVGDAYVEGVMELNCTKEGDRGKDEVFKIF
jgi:hypothetical protein